MRLFVAAYPPPETAALLVDAMRGLELPPHRVVPAEQVHMTLQFVGDTPPAQLDEVIESVRRSASGLAAFELLPRRLMSLPERGPARLVAAETDAPPGLRELRRRLVTRLARDPRPNGRERFLPHVTLCRFRSPSRVAPIDLALDIGPFAVREVVLMRSTLLADGARHDRVAAAPLA